MKRNELEQEVLRRLKIKKAKDINPVARSLKLKTTKALEDILERMKAEGR
jgi:hypothetical protein